MEVQCSKRRLNLKAIIAALRRRVAKGDLAAMWELGTWLQEGSRDRKGRSLLRSNPEYAFRLLKASAEGGYKEAAASLGYAYDVGLGAKRSKHEAVRWYMVDFRHGGTTGAANLATIYSDADDLRRAFGWWRRAAAMGDGDAMGDVGYCYQYGIGVRRNAASARRLYRRAINSKDITEWGREEALYHFALSYLDGDKPKLALLLLKRAAKDGDYPEADAVLGQLRETGKVAPCRCRRFIRKSLRGHAKCAVHPRIKKHKS